MSREAQLLIAALSTPEAQAELARLGRDLESHPEQLRAWVARLDPAHEPDPRITLLPEHCDQ